MKVVSVGDILIDFTPIAVDGNGYPSIQANPGGDVGNFLAACSKFGAETAFIGKIGDDTFGHLLIDTLNRCNIGTAGIVLSKDYFTTLGFVTLDAQGERDFSFMHSADIHLTYDEINLSLLEGADALHFSTVSMTAEPGRSTIKKLIQYAKNKGILISFDPNLRENLWGNLEDCREQILWALSISDVVKISDNEVEYLYGLSPEKGCEKILSHYNAKLVYVTCGAKGCYYSNRAVSGFVPALKGLSILDTVGAGDIFGGSALWKLLSATNNPSQLTKAELDEIVTFATTAAGLSTTKRGGMTSVPSLEEIAKHTPR